MNQRERVLAAIKGQPVDHVPSLFSLHFPKEVSAGEAAVEATSPSTSKPVWT